MEKNQPCVPAFVSNESKIKKSADKGRGKRCAVFSNAGGGLGLTCFKNVKLSWLYLVCARAAEAFGFLLTNEKNTGEVTRTPKTNTTAWRENDTFCWQEPCCYLLLPKNSDTFSLVLPFGFDIENVQYFFCYYKRARWKENKWSVVDKREARATSFPCRIIVRGCRVLNNSFVWKTTFAAKWKRVHFLPRGFVCSPPLRSGPWFIISEFIANR